MKNSITLVVTFTIIAAFTGLAEGVGFSSKRTGPPNTVQTGGGQPGGSNGKTNRKNARQPTSGGQNNNSNAGTGSGIQNGGNNVGGKNTPNTPTQTNKPTQKKKVSLVHLLGLKGEVAKKFLALRKAFTCTTCNITKNKLLSNKEKAIQIRVASKKYKEELEKILTPQQLAKLKMINMRVTQSHTHNNNKQPHIGPHVAKALKLTPEQRDRLAAARAHAHKRIYQVLSNKKLKLKQKQVHIKAIHGQFQRRIIEILTPQQLAMLKEIHAASQHMSGCNGKKNCSGNPA